jgi:peroxiredoxin
MLLNRFATGIFLLLVAVLLTGDLLLLRRNGELRQALEQNLALTAGERVPSLYGLDQQRRPVDLSFGKGRRPTLLLAFSTDCDFCEENWPAWEKLMQIAKKRDIRVVAVDLGRPPSADYVLQHSLVGTRLMAEVDPASVQSYRLRMAPTTMLISPGGTVLGIWVGVLREGSLTEATLLLREMGR